MKQNLEWEQVIEVVTPLTSIVAVIIYSIALFTATRQNRMILSQNLRPHFEELIKEYVEMGKAMEATPLIPGAKGINVFNYREELKDAFYKLLTHPDYNVDLQMVRIGKVITLEDLWGRDYYPDLELIINLLDEPVGLNFFHTDVAFLIRTVNDSKMITEDKEIIKQKIRNKLLMEYFKQLNHFETDSRHAIHLLRLSNGKVVPKKLEETDFFKYRHLFVKELTNSRELFVSKR
ncbi:hypothetical protein ACXYMT_13965 [Salinimicrobium sp. CAU 1759]